MLYRPILSQEPSFAWIFGVRVHRTTMDEVVAYLRALLASSGSHQVVTLNLQMLDRAVQDVRFRSIVNRASLVTPDGMGVLLVGSILGTRFPERVAGVDLVDRLCALCAEHGWRVYLLGSAPGVAAMAADALQRRYPGLQVAGTHHGYFRSDEEHLLVQQIRSATPHLLLAALGSPKQEEWLVTHLQTTGAVVGIGVGGSLDVYAGRARLAPGWIRGIGLEWAYRLMREPRRWRTILTLPLLVLFALRERISTEWKKMRNQGY